MLLRYYYECSTVRDRLFAPKSTFSISFFSTVGMTHCGRRLDSGNTSLFHPVFRMGLISDRLVLALHSQNRLFTFSSSRYHIFVTTGKNTSQMWQIACQMSNPPGLRLRGCFRQIYFQPLAHGPSTMFQSAASGRPQTRLKATALARPCWARGF